MLSDPLVLRSRVLRNRLVFCAHLTNQARDRLPSPAHTAYYAARAAGGAALVITEEQAVDPADQPYEGVVDGTDPAVVDRYREIAAAVHGSGALVVAQLNHNGGQGSSLHTRAPLLAPSPVADPLFGEVPREATPADLAAVVAGFARVAGHVRDGGLDGVELQASQSSLLRALLDPSTNRRTDGYGTDRARLLLEVVAAVRGALGPDLLLGVRLATAEPGGTTTDDAVATAHRLAATGAVDWLSTTTGVATASLHLVEPSMAGGHGYALPLAARLRTAGLPVIGVGRVTTPAEAEAALAHCDLVGVVRGQLADPDFGAKALRGDPVRACTGCNECTAGIGAGLPVRCVQGVLPVPAVPARARHVVVVGGGPAGLRAAAHAAARGHRVTLLEAADRLGGALALAATAPGRGELAGFVEADVRACAEHGVDVRTGVRATAADLADLQPDAVVLACGASPARPAWAGDAERVADVADVLAGAAAPSGRVLVVDELGGPHATSTAELLAARGCAVEVVTGALVAAQRLGPTLDRGPWHRRAAAAGIVQTVERVPLAVRDGVVTLLHHLTGDVEERVVDWVVAATHPDPVPGPAAPTGVEVHRVGDCLAPAGLAVAVATAERVVGSWAGSGGRAEPW
ncbi:oxidoreductase [Klenkia brasiliensis]|uniref:Pyridine nucleotide-disulphide oxidoreductase n=1 Tax=Klenkia brasiliensis TaxID=333142 RepID=A0A1G7PJ54_9ACTN|nr:FAD-dependent oxidoreductase [Klenkia brasiliensis]SDF86267.1 Pyridine nucleotide-disulphide oxidoreductase [Klenkia brasiliensis]